MKVVLVYKPDGPYPFKFISHAAKFVGIPAQTIRNYIHRNKTNEYYRGDITIKIFK